MKEIIKNTIAILNKAERRKVLLLVLLNLLFNILDIAFLAFLLAIVQLYADPAKASRFPFLSSWITDPTSLWPIIIFFVLFAVKNLGSLWVYKAQCKFRHQVVLRISKNNLLGYLQGSYEDYVYIDSAVHCEQVYLHPTDFCQYVMDGFMQSIGEWTLIGLTIIAVVLYNAKLFLLLLLVLLPPMILTAWFTQKTIRSAKFNIVKRRGLAWQHLEETVIGFVESNLYGKNKFFVNRFGQSQSMLYKHLTNLQAIQGAPSRLAEIFAIFGLLILVSVNHFLGAAQGSHFVTLGVFITAAYKIIPSISKILNINGQIKAYAFTVESLIKKKEEAKFRNEVKKVEKITSVSAKNISFKFGQLSILKNLNVHIKAGDFVGIEGSSGRGKTTLVNILLGLLSPQEGLVLFNGNEISETVLDGYWERIAYIKQQPFIIHGNILTNITMNEDGHDAARLQMALSFSGLDVVIANLPNGILKEISENGKNISGGQRQRISIARALYKEADLYILDEPFSELDEVSENKLLAHFKQLTAQGKLVVIITHNKKSLSYCSTVLSMGDL